MNDTDIFDELPDALRPALADLEGAMAAARWSVMTTYDDLPRRDAIRRLRPEVEEGLRDRLGMDDDSLALLFRPMEHLDRDRQYGALRELAALVVAAEASGLVISDGY